VTRRGNASGACRKNRRETAASFLRRMVSTPWFGESHSYQSKHSSDSGLFGRSGLVAVSVIGLCQ